MKLFALLVLIVAGSSSAASGNDRVRLFLKWKHQFQFAGYYAALEKGFYAAEGIDVEIIERDIKWTTFSKVGSKEKNYGISDSSIIGEYLRGKPYVIVSPIFQHSPLALATRVEDGILSPIELIGKRVMYQKGIDDAVFKIMFENLGMDEEDIVHVPHTQDIHALIRGEVDAISIYSTNQPFYYQKLGQPIRLLDPANYGVDLYGDMLFTSQKELTSAPARVAGMRRASIRGWYYALNHVEEIIQLIKKKYSPQADLDQLRFEAEATKRVIRADLVPIGEARVSRLRRIANSYGKRWIKKELQIENILYKNFLKSQRFSRSMLVRLILTILGIFTVLFAFFSYFNARLKRKVLQKTSELVAIQKQKELLFSTLTHELRTPINGIIGSTYFLSEARSAQEREELIRAITVSGEVLLDVVNDILDFSKLERGAMSLDPKPVRLERMVKDFLLSHRHLANMKNLSFDVNFNLAEDLCLNLDEIKFGQVLNNVIANAIKFTSSGGVVVTFDGELQNDLASIKVTVCDSGPGVQIEELERIFTPFKQANNKISSSYGGTGLGLAIAKEIAGLMGGGLEARNNKDKGMTFTFWIESEVVEATEVKLPEQIEFPDYKFLRVLVVDDSKLNVFLLEKYFLKFNIKVEKAFNGQEALELLGRKQIDIVLMDRQMPIMGGEEACRRIRAHQDPMVSQVYLVGQSANWINQTDPTEFGLILDATLAKPTKINDVRDLLENYVTYKRLQKHAS